MRARLNWDAGNLAKCQKHGVSIEEIADLFAYLTKRDKTILARRPK